MVGYVKNDPTLALLAELFEAGDLARLALVEIAQEIFSKKYRQEKAKQKAQSLLWRLKQNGYIKNIKREQKMLLTLTDKGQQRAFASVFNEAQLLPKNKWLVVIFDIPEKQAKARREFRWFLRQHNFIKLQQSVWVSQRQVYKPLKDLSEQLDLGEWINIFYAQDFYKKVKVS